MVMNNLPRLVLSLFLLAVLSCPVHAVPAWPGLHTFQQPDGLNFSGYQKGDESGAWLETVDGYVFKHDSSDGWYSYVQKTTDVPISKMSAPKSADLRVGLSDPGLASAARAQDLSGTASETKSALAASDGVQTMAGPSKQFLGSSLAGGPSYALPSNGTHRVVVILVEFNDTVHNSSHTSAYFQNLLFNSSNPLSMNSYYREVSYGKLNVTGIVVGWYASSHSLSFYGADNSSLSYPNSIDSLNGNVSELTREAVTLADSDVDFSDYDADANGVVDHVIVIHAGYGQEFSSVTNDIWSHRWSVRPAQVADGKNVSGYSMDPEYGTLGVFCHEFGHDLGLPDLYNTATGATVVRYWDLMDYGSWGGPGSDGTVPTHLGAWSKAFLGWSNVTSIYNSSRSYNVQNAESSPNAYLVNDSTLTAQNEYFLVENREQSGFDAYLPGQGIIIWHVDDFYVNAGLSSNQVNRNTMKGVVTENVSTINDAPYSVNASKQHFNSTTTPNSSTNLRYATNVSIYVEGPVSNSMVVHFFGGNSSDMVPPTLSPVHIGSSNGNASWATVGNSVNLSFSSDKALNQTPAVTISSHNATVYSAGGYSYFALYNMTVSDNERAVPFTIDFFSLNNVAGTQVTGTTDNSSVFFDRTPPSVTLSLPLNGSFSSNTSVLANFTGFDRNSTLLSCTLLADGSANASWTGLANGSVQSSTPAAFSEGAHNLSANCSDFAGNFGTSATSTFTIDLTLPSVAITSPANGSFAGASINVSVSAYDANLNYTNVSVYNSTGFLVNSTTDQANGNFSVVLSVPADGLYNISATAFDKAQNSAAYNVSNLTSDTTAPLVSISLPDNSTLVSNVFVLNFSALDSLSGIDSGSCSYSVNAGANVSVPNCANTTANTSVTNGQVNFTLYASDLSGNANSSIASFHVDMAGPVIAIQSPAANSVLLSNASALNFTVNDGIAGVNNTTCQYSINSAARQNITDCANITLPEQADGAITLVLYAKDNLGNEGSAGVSFVVDVAGTNATVPLNNTTTASGNVTIVVTEFSPAAGIMLGSGATNSSLNLSGLSSNSSTVVSVNVTNQINVTAETSLGNVTVQIPGSLTINGSSSWNGVISLPSVQSSAAATPTDSGSNAVNGVVQIGLEGEQLNFSSAVRILIPGMGSKSAGYVRGTTFTKITATCTTDSQAWADANLNPASECVTTANSGSDMVIWTKHFTQFLAYTNTPPASNYYYYSSSSSGMFVATTTPSASSNSSATNSYVAYVNLSTGKSCAVNVTRKLTSTTGLSTLTTTLENIGGFGCSMVNLLFTDTLPTSFAAPSLVTFVPQYASIDAWTANFSIPSFVFGESKTLAYSVSQNVNTSVVTGFSNYRLTAEPLPVQQPALETRSIVSVTPTPKASPVLATSTPTPAPAAPAVQPTGDGLLFIAALAILLVAGVVGLLIYLKGALPPNEPELMAEPPVEPETIEEPPKRPDAIAEQPKEPETAEGTSLEERPPATPPKDAYVPVKSMAEDIRTRSE